MATAKVVRVSPVFTRNGAKTITFGLNFTWDGVLDPTLADLILANTVVWQWWNNGVQSGAAAKTLFAASIQLSASRAQMVSPTPGLPALDSRPAVAGTAAGESVPPQLSPVVSFYTNVASRSGRGRVFLPNPPEAELAGSGAFTQAYSEDLRDSIQNLTDDIEAQAGYASGDWTHGVWSRLQDVIRPVNDVRVGVYVDTQRRRRTKNESFV